MALDIGNVLVKVETDPFLQKLSETLNITIPDASRFIRRFQQLHDLGYTTMEDELKDKFSIKSPFIIANLVNAWNMSIVPHLPILTKLNDLRKKYNLEIALLSNIGVEHAAMIDDKLKHEGFLENTIRHFSCFVGARKPSMLFYQSFLLQYPQFKGCVYVDDLKENLAASEQFGFKTFHLDLNNDGLNDRLDELEHFVINSVVD